MDREKGQLDSEETAYTPFKQTPSPSKGQQKESGVLREVSCTIVFPRTLNKNKITTRSLKENSDNPNKHFPNGDSRGRVGKRHPKDTPDKPVTDSLEARGLDSCNRNVHPHVEKTTVSTESSLPNDTPLDRGENLSEKGDLFLSVIAEVSPSSEGHQTGCITVYASDKQSYTDRFKKHGIRDVNASRMLPVNSEGGDKVLVRLRLHGEDKDSWRHCETADEKPAFSEVQYLDLERILQRRSTFPATAHWFLETPEKCTPSAHLEAVVEIQQVSNDSTSLTWDDSSEVISILVEVGN